LNLLRSTRNVPLKCFPVSIALLIAGCGEPDTSPVQTGSAVHRPSPSHSSSDESSRLVTLASSVQPLRDHFNGLPHQARLVAILSSGCGTCTETANAIKEAVLDSNDDEISVSLVWTTRSPGDKYKKAEWMSRFIDDARVRHFYDPNQLTGRIFGPLVMLSPQQPAWDVFLFYPPGVSWSNEPPAPVRWMHQLPGTGLADPTHRFTGDNLTAQLRNATDELSH
jgi:hypothetical protein